GWVPELMPEARGRGLFFREEKGAPKWDEKTLAVFKMGSDSAENISAAVQSGAAASGGKTLIAEVRRAANSPWNADRCYVDLLYPGVTEKFLEVTLGAYQREIGK